MMIFGAPVLQLLANKEGSWPRVGL
jgi:hypothetical protein